MNGAIVDDFFYTEEILQLLRGLQKVKKLFDYRSVWVWTKIDIRDHAIQFSSKRAAAERTRKEYASAKQIYENDTCENNLNKLIMAREYEEKTGEEGGKYSCARSLALIWFKKFQLFFLT